MFSDAHHRIFSRWLVAIFLTTVLAVGGAGYYAYRQSRAAAEQEVRDQLLGVADTKLRQLQAWTEERFADARMISSDQPLLAALDAAVEGRARPQQKQELRQWMDALCGGARYANAFLFDNDARLVLQCGSAYGDPAHFREVVEQARAAKLAILRDLHVDSHSAKLHLGLNIPLRLGAESETFGVLSLGIDPERTIFPILDRPPVPAGGGDTVLVRREGDEALFLNRLEQNGAARQSVHVPLSRGELVTVQAILGKRGLVEGLDRGGEPVLAAIRAVPESQWLLISRISVERIQGPIRRRAIQIVFVVVLLILVAGLGVTLLWRLERLRLEEARRKVELEKEVLASHYNYLSRSALDGILLLDERGLILETNERALEMYGYSRGELLGLHAAALHSGEEREKFEQHWRRVRTESGLLVETQHARKDGTVFPVEINVRPIVVEGTTYYQAIVRDITERNQARKQLEDANRLYAVLSGSNQAIAKAATEQEVFDSVCRIGAETGGFKIVAIGMADESGTWLHPMACAGESSSYARSIELPAGPGQAVESPIAKAFQTGQVCVIDDIAEDPNPTPWHERARACGLGSAVCVPLSRQGRVAGVLAIFKAEPHFSVEREVALVEEMGADISYALERLDVERKRNEAEAALRAGEQRYRQLVESLPGGILVHRNLRVIYMSPAGLRMFGASSLDEVVGRSLFDLIHPDYHESVRRRAEAGASAPARTEEERFARLDGTAYDVEVSAVPIEIDGQKARLVSFLDITQRKKAEEERAKLEQQFLQAQKMESVGRLAGGVAHDFNNHLTVINGYCEILLTSLPAGDPIRADVASIRKAGQRAAELVRQLLAFSRKRVSEPKLVDLNLQVLDSRRMLERLIGEQIVFETVFAADLGEVLADPTQIQQILMNLVVNARDAMSAGGRLTIETRNVHVDAEQAAHQAGARPGDFVCLAVSDTGVGMDAATLGHIFEPFFTTKPLAVGTGLGLSTVYGIVRQSNGWIEVESAPGAGATFRIFLPGVAGGRAPEAHAALVGNTAAGCETILLVEDQPGVLELSATILKGLGYAVLEAAGGVEALAVAAAHPGAIDILVSDVVMPGLTGPQLARELRALRPLVKVLYVSGYATEEQMGEAVAGENVHRLSKPFTPAVLAAKVREVLGA
jgi:PAS domain S-box-containing protein